MRKKWLTGLWRHPEFVKLWGSFTITSFGAQITNLALPLTAALLLNASALQMGILIALETLPFALISLFAGVWVDRLRKLPLIIWTDIGRGIVLLAIPLVYWWGKLSIEILYIVGFLCGVMNVIGGTAAQVFLANMVGRDRLVEANSKVAFGQTSADLVGPGLAGLLIQWLTAPFAILLDAISFFVSGWMLRHIRSKDEPTSSGQNIWQEIGAGLKLVWRNPVLRSLAWTVAIWQLLHHMYLVVIILFATREIGLSAGMVGMVYMLSGLGCLLGALWTASNNQRFGVGPMTVSGLFATALAWQIFSLTGGPYGLALAELGLGMLLFGFGATSFTINYLSLRQAITPDALLGRMTASMRFLTVAVAPVGSLLGGVLGSLLGLRATLMIVGVSGLLLVGLAMTLTPMRKVRELPTPE